MTTPAPSPCQHSFGISGSEEDKKDIVCMWCDGVKLNIKDAVSAYALVGELVGVCEEAYNILNAEPLDASMGMDAVSRHLKVMIDKARAAQQGGEK